MTFGPAKVPWNGAVALFSSLAGGSAWSMPLLFVQNLLYNELDRLIVASSYAFGPTAGQPSVC